LQPSQFLSGPVENKFIQTEDGNCCEERNEERKINLLEGVDYFGTKY
jgi:hypothetical protein